jgi:redox-sensitive bicupin YhaK (pirin superfamily)
MKFDAPVQTVESFASRDLSIGALQVARALPVRARRLVGPWCLLDRFGPLTFSGDKPMDVAPHPHTGMQTVTWLLDGEVLHDDSLGCEAVVRPGGVNVMTAGSGIAHAEQTPLQNNGRLNGVQLWVALPDAHRQVAPSFVSVEHVPLAEHRGGVVQAFAGSLDGSKSPGPHYSELVAADVQVHAGQALELGLDARYEHAVLVLSGSCSVEGQTLEDRHLYYLGTNRSSVSFGSGNGARLLLIGGPPFPETILMWWNFVARTPEEIVQARTDWEEHRRFGDVRAYAGPRLDAPPLVRLARPNPIS